MKETEVQTLMRVDIDQRRCCGYRLCVEVAPNVFQINSAGKAFVVPDQIPAECQEDARAAAKECPSAAIQVSADEGVPK